LPNLEYINRARSLAQAAVSKTNAAIVDGLPIQSDPVRFAVQTLGTAIEEIAAYLEEWARETDARSV
jgi:hypothetical protein